MALHAGRSDGSQQCQYRVAVSQLVRAMSVVDKDDTPQHILRNEAAFRAFGESLPEEDKLRLNLVLEVGDMEGTYGPLPSRVDVNTLHPNHVARAHQIHAKPWVEGTVKKATASVRHMRHASRACVCEGARARA